MSNALPMRHAEAVEREGLVDLERALTPKGERQAQRMADWLNQRIAHSTRVLVSPALRCQQTAKALGRKFKTAEAIAPGASPQVLLDAARWPEASEPVLVVGHQPTLGETAALLLAPTLGETAALLLAGQPQPWPIKKGAVWWVRSRDREGSAQVVLHAVMGPDGL